MPRTFIALLLAPLVAQAAPVPKQTEMEKIEAKFGKITDPKGDSTFALDGDALKITLPAGESRGFGVTKETTDPDKSAKYAKFNHSPRVEFERTGDFVLTVRVCADLSDGANKIKGVTAHVGGGIALTRKGGDWYRFGVARLQTPLPAESGRTIFPVDEPQRWTHGLSGSLVDKKLDSQKMWLRVKRAAKDFSCEASLDSEAWESLWNVRGELTDETMTLAIYAQHGSDTSHTVTFDNFSVEKPKAEKK